MNDLQIFKFIKEHLVQKLSLVLTEDISSNFVKDWIDAWNDQKGATPSTFSKKRLEANLEHSKGNAITFLERPYNGSTQKSNKMVFERDCITLFEKFQKEGKVKGTKDEQKVALSYFQKTLDSYLAHFDNSGNLIGEKGGANGNITRETESRMKTIDSGDANREESAKINRPIIFKRIKKLVSKDINTASGGRN